MTLPYVKTGTSSIRRLHPLSCSITLNVKPLSTVRMTLPQTDEISIWEWVTVPVPDGSTIWCQVVTIETDAETGRKDIYLEHGARTLDAATIRRDDGLTKTPYAFKTGNPPVVMTVSQIMTKILSYQSPARWTVGTIAQAIAGQAVYMEPEGMSLTTAILTMMESIPAYQANFVQASDSDWHIDIVARPTTVQAEVRLNRNLRSCEISCNASAICTRVWCEGITGGKMDSANTSLYGVREETMSLNDSLTTAQKEAIVTAYLAAHDHPIISLSISGYELSQVTGLDIDSLLLGQLCRVAVPWLGVTESEVIVTKTYGDAYNAPDEVTVSLADQTPDLSIVVASITGGGGGGGGGKQKESPLKRFQTKFEQTDELFRLLATDTQWDDMGHGTITAYSQIVQTASSLQSVVSRTGYTTDAFFDPSHSYAVGDIVMYDGKMYEFTAAHTGAWTGADVTQITSMYSTITQNESNITMLVSKTGVNSLGQSETLYSKITQNADLISLVVQGTGSSASIKIQAIVDGINSSAVQISADKIYLNGQTIASSLSATDARITNLMSGDTRATKISTNRLDAGVVAVPSDGQLMVSGKQATWKTKYVLDSGTTATVQSLALVKRDVVYINSSQQETHGDHYLITSYSNVTVPTSGGSSIYYLGSSTAPS